MIDKYDAITKNKFVRCTENFSYNSRDNEHFLSQEELKNLIITNVPGAKEVLK